MNPYTAVLTDTNLRAQQNSTNELTSSALGVLLLAEQLDANTFSGVDYYAEVERRLLTVYGLPPYFVRQIATNIFAERRHKLNRGF